MISLKDYLGTIISDINHARGMADVASASLAKQYSEDDVLQFYSVPRVRLGDVALTIPIGIDTIQRKSENNYQPIDNNDFYSKTYHKLKEEFRVDSFDQATSKALTKTIKNEVNRLEKEIKATDNIEEQLKRFSGEIAEHSMSIVKKGQKNLKFNTEKGQSPKMQHLSLQENLMKSLMPEIKPRQYEQKVENAFVITESDKLREIKPENLMIVKMNIKESGMEWHTMENANGDIVSKLTAE